jgi:hypothetical protein
MSGDGKIQTSGTATIKAYSLLNFNDTSTFTADTIFSAMGFDVSLYAEYPVFSTLDVAVDLKHIPIVGGKVPYEVNFVTDFDMTIESLMSGELEDMDDKLSDPEAEFTDSDKRLYRPFEMGFSAAYRPAKWFAFLPSINFVFDKPFFVEYGLGAQFHWSKWIFATVSTNYENRNFVQRLELLFNARVFELEIILQSNSADFLKSFQLAGVGAGVGIKLGF